MSDEAGPRTIGRYELHDRIGAGGMAAVHLGLLRGAGGFVKSVAIKRMHPELAAEPGTVDRFAAEARLSARAEHPHVVSTLDVIEDEDDLFIVMQLVVGEPLSRLLAAHDGPVAPPVAAAIASDLLRGLHAAHEATDEGGEPLSLVHRDVSPQNLMVGLDGRARVLDFGIAKAKGATQRTEEGVVKGKASYMAPEQIYGEELDRRTDVYAAGVVLWEMLTGQALFPGSGADSKITKVLEKPVRSPAAIADDVPAALARVTLRALERDPEERFESAEEMATAIEACLKTATPEAVGAWVAEHASGELEQLRGRVAELESQAIEKAGRRPDEPASGVTRAALALALTALFAWAFRDLIVEPAPRVFPKASPPVRKRVFRRPPPPPRAKPKPASSAVPRGPATAPPAPSVRRPSPPPAVPRSAPTAPAATAEATAAPAPTAAPRPDCDPPFTLTPDGHRRYKRECLQPQ